MIRQLCERDFMYHSVIQPECSDFSSVVLSSVS
uniref:Uncharacterized protein n=1 Tax=Anguilla anguilla TaxID=7936 RepID=A0A0E9U2G5_ANGAN